MGTSLPPSRKMTLNPGHEVWSFGFAATEERSALELEAPLQLGGHSLPVGLGGQSLPVRFGGKSLPVRFGGQSLPPTNYWQPIAAPASSPSATTSSAASTT